jgi:hypothetical protein
MIPAARYADLTLACNSDRGYVLPAATSSYQATERAIAMLLANDTA